MNPPAFQTARAAPSEDDLDAGEFASFASRQDPRDIEAATWAVRRRDGLDASGRAELQAWLARDPRHGAALQDMDATFGNIEALPGADVAALRAGLAGRRAPPREAAGGRGRPWFAGGSRLVPPMAAALLVVMAIGGGWLGWGQWQRQPVFVQAFATERGQQLTLRLPDDALAGSTLQLDTGTRLEARLYRGHREVVLANGQAMFTVHPDASRPFHVRVGSLRVTVVGTRFSVRHTASGLDAGRTVVSVEEGHVRVARVDAEAHGDAAGADAHAGVDLTAGRMLVADAGGQLGPVTLVAPTAIAPWRTGRISFDRTPLAQALAEFERYGHTGLVVRDPAVAAMPVGGSYDLRQFQHFARTLPDVLPVRLERRGDVSEVVAR